MATTHVYVSDFDENRLKQNFLLLKRIDSTVQDEVVFLEGDQEIVGDIIISSPDGGVQTLLTIMTEGASGRPRLTFTNDSGSWLYEVNGGNFEINRSGSGGEREFVIDSAGRVGVGATTPASSAMMEVRSTTRGFLPPKMTTAQRDAISSPTSGLIIYNTTTNKHQGYNGTTWNDFY